jgi:hypothetical protein
MSKDHDQNGADVSRPAGQGLGAQGPGNQHGIPAAHEPDTEARPFDPQGGKPAQDPDAMAKKLLDHANTGPQSADDMGPEAAGS